MFVIGIFICAAFVLLVQIILQDFRSQPAPLTYTNDSNDTLSSLISDSVLNSWLQDSSLSVEWKVPSNHLSKSSLAKSGRKSENLEFSATNKYGFSNATKERILESFLSTPSTEVKPDWSVVLGTFEYYAEDNWDGYLTQIGVPYLLRALVGSISETVTVSRIFKDGKEDFKGIEEGSHTNELGTTSNDSEILIESYFWPITVINQFRLRVPVVEYDLDGTDSVNTFYFVSPRILIQEKVKDAIKMTTIRHFYEQGVNMTLLVKEQMASANRYLKRIE